MQTAELFAYQIALRSRCAAQRVITRVETKETAEAHLGAKVNDAVATVLVQLKVTAPASPIHSGQTTKDAKAHLEA